MPQYVRIYPLPDTTLKIQQGKRAKFNVAVDDIDIALKEAKEYLLMGITVLLEPIPMAWVRVSPEQRPHKKRRSQ